MPDLNGRVALVTGGARRLGAAMTEALAGWGASLAIHYAHSADEAEQLAERIRELGGDASTFGCDLTDPEAAVRLPRRVVEDFGRLDILVNSAAVLVAQQFGSVVVDEWNQVIDLNLRAPFLVTQSAAPHLRESRGVVINIADLSARRPWANYLPHSVSKAGVVMLTRALALELAPQVRVNAIAPGSVLLPDDWGEQKKALIRDRTPLGRLGSPQAVVQALSYLLENDFTTGDVIVVDGGYSLSGWNVTDGQ